MEQNYVNPLPFKHISTAANEAVTYIRRRKNHEIEPLKSRWNKFNEMCCGGIEPGCVYTIVGASGTGKSSFVNTLETDLIELNLVEETAESLKDYPIYYVDDAATVQKIDDTITYFQNTIAKDKWLIVILDHTLLVNSDNYKDERMIISELERVFIKAKKVGMTSIIQLSQMNRNIENIDRINNPSSHYPMRSDLSSSDSVFQGSDVIAVLSRPETLGITAYGPQRLPVQNKVYLHFLKVREGELAILEFENDLKYNNLIEL